jgi:flagellar basal body rod protein FlgF
MSTIQSSAEHLTLNADGSSKDIKLQANGVEKASISSSGVTHSSSSYLDMGANHIYLADNAQVKFGTSEDLQIYHDGSNSYIRDAGTGDIHIRSDAGFRVQNANGTENYIYAEANGKVRLYYDNNTKLDTTATGLEVTGNIDLADNGKLLIGSGNDLQIYHDGSHSYIDDTGTGDLTIRAGNDLRLQDPNTKAYMTCNEGGSVEIYFDNVKKLETLTTGIELYGNMEINSGFAITGEGGSTRLSVAHNTGNVWIDGNCSAASFTDRTPYPETLQLAYDVINSHKKLPDGQYKADDHSKQLDHSQLHDYVKEEDNNRNMSGVISCLVEVIKDLSAKVKALEDA